MIVSRLARRHAALALSLISPSLAAAGAGTACGRPDEVQRTRASSQSIDRSAADVHRKPAPAAVVLLRKPFPWSCLLTSWLVVAAAGCVCLTPHAAAPGEHGRSLSELAARLHHSARWPATDAADVSASAVPVFREPVSTS